jgi:hypothetical protein
MTSSETRPVRREQSSDHAAPPCCGALRGEPPGPERSGCTRGLPYIAYILIVDTQAELRQHLVRMLEQAGHRATTVATVWEAPEACAAAATARERKPAPAHVTHRGNGLEASV